MTDNKYNQLKKAIEEMVEMFPEDETMKDMKELTNAIDKGTPAQQKEADLMTEQAFKAMTYSERVGLNQERPEAYSNAMAGNFKGGKVIHENRYRNHRYNQSRLKEN